MSNTQTTTHRQTDDPPEEADPGPHIPLSEFTPETTTKEVTHTAILSLETSAWKIDKVQQAIEEYQAMVAYMADMLPSVPPHKWTTMNSTLYRMVVREFPHAERLTGSVVARDACGDAVAQFKSWRENGFPGDRPNPAGNRYLSMSNQEFTLVRHEDGQGYGLKVDIIPGEDPLWFHISPGPSPTNYGERHLDRVFDGESSMGGAKLALNADDRLAFHLPIKTPVEVYEPDEVATTVGVDLGENTLYAAAVVTPHSHGSGDSDIDVAEVDMESGREFRHHRDRLTAKRAHLQKQGDRRGVKVCRNEHRKYTDQVTHTAARRVVQLAVDHRPAVIALEDLTDYRDDADNPIHDWPFRELKEKIMTKATTAGIPVEEVDPAHTSDTCRKCGQTDREYRDRADFACRRCGYEVHADVNAAINIAQRAAD